MVRKKEISDSENLLQILLTNSHYFINVIFLLPIY